MTGYAEHGLGWAEERFPRSARWGWEFAYQNLMGPNALWLAESLSEVVNFRPDMRVLDLGCGKAITSIFLAKEFGVQAWAADLWIRPTENLARIESAAMGDRVFPIYAEAHALPFAHDFFDAVVSFDAYHYFGTADLYTFEIAKFLKPGGILGIVVPGLTREFESVPEALAEWWDPQFMSFHTPAWWRRHWEFSGRFRVEHADLVPDGWRAWVEWNEACDRLGGGDGTEAKMLRADGGALLGFSRMVGRKV